MTRDAACKFLDKDGLSVRHEDVTTHWVSAAELRPRQGSQAEPWIAEAYPDRLTGYDLVGSVRIWLREEKEEAHSVCEVLKARDWDGVGDAEVFVSHAQVEGPGLTIDLMTIVNHAQGRMANVPRQEARQWVDFFSLRQCASDFAPREVYALIKLIGVTAVAMDFQEEKKAIGYLSRSFCLLEAWATIDSGGKLLIESRVGNMSDFTDDVLKVDSEKAQTRRPEDKQKVDDFIRAGVGFERLNKAIEEEIGRADASQMMCLAKLCCCCPCSLVGLCLDACVPRNRNPCYWALP
jgi:hypothetical protein